MCFAWISEQTAIISLYSNHLSVFAIKAESVYCAVQFAPFKSGRYNFVLKGLKDILCSVINVGFH